MKADVRVVLVSRAACSTSPTVAVPQSLPLSSVHLIAVTLSSLIAWLLIIQCHLHSPFPLSARFPSPGQKMECGGGRWWLQVTWVSRRELAPWTLYLPGVLLTPGILVLHVREHTSFSFHVVWHENMPENTNTDWQCFGIRDSRKKQLLMITTSRYWWWKRGCENEFRLCFNQRPQEAAFLSRVGRSFHDSLRQPNGFLLVASLFTIKDQKSGKILDMTLQVEDEFLCVLFFNFFFWKGRQSEITPIISKFK